MATSKPPLDKGFSRPGPKLTSAQRDAAAKKRKAKPTTPPKMVRLPAPQVGKPKPKTTVRKPAKPKPRASGATFSKQSNQGINAQKATARRSAQARKNTTARVSAARSNKSKPPTTTRRTKAATPSATRIRRPSPRPGTKGKRWSN